MTQPEQKRPIGHNENSQGNSPVKSPVPKRIRNNEAPAFEDPQAAGALGAQAANPAEAGTAALVPPVAGQPYDASLLAKKGSASEMASCYAQIRQGEQSPEQERRQVKQQERQSPMPQQQQRVGTNMRSAVPCPASRTSEAEAKAIERAYYKLQLEKLRSNKNVLLEEDASLQKQLEKLEAERRLNNMGISAIDGRRRAVAYDLAFQDAQLAALGRKLVEEGLIPARPAQPDGSAGQK